jgi:hypothetical protein
MNLHSTTVQDVADELIGAAATGNDSVSPMKHLNVQLTSLTQFEAT